MLWTVELLSNSWFCLDAYVCDINDQWFFATVTSGIISTGERLLAFSTPCTAIYLWLRFFSILILHAATWKVTRNRLLLQTSHVLVYVYIRRIETQNSFNNNANFYEKVRVTTRKLNLTSTDLISMPLRSKNARTSERIQFADRLDSWSL